MLRNAGHSVSRYVTTGTPVSSLLNAADLVIISRSVPSGDYEDDLETALWNSITAPTMILDGYILRSSRLGYTTGTTIPDTAGTVKLQVNNPLHPIFWGIALDGANTTVNTYATSGTAGTIFFNGVPQRGISVNTDPLAGGGTALATVAAGDPNATGGMILGEWQAGALMGTSPADRLGGHRLVFLTGTREADELFSECAGMYDLTPDGAQLFLNAVSYMTPAPCPHRASAVAVVVNGVVVRALITDRGCGYTNAPKVLIKGGGGSGATATAVVSNNVVVAINIVSGGTGYTNTPYVQIASPPFAPSVTIEVSRVNVRQHVVLGHRYVLESSTDLVNWVPTGPEFTADSESIVTEFLVDETSRFFRLKALP